MRKVLFQVVILSVIFTKVESQDILSKLQNYHPVTPAAFEFTKYTDMPVSEYTGVTGISIPLYQIEEDGVTVPINLTYHAGGIRVNQEASWVGLGWDLTFGSIVQEINDVDDYSTYTNVVKLRPDYKWSPYPTYFPTKTTYPNCLNIPGNGWSDPFTAEPFEGKYSFMISTAYWVPVNEDFDDQQLGEKVLSFQEYDSEPDIFTANILGESLKFRRHYPHGVPIVLNKKGYTVSRSGNNFTIINPSGDTYYFEIYSDIITQTTSVGLSYTNTNNYEPNSKIWMLTKIITRNKKTIQFSYTETQPVNDYPTVSQRLDKLTSPVVNSHNLVDFHNLPNVEGYGNLSVGNELSTATSRSMQKRFYLSSITFPNGEIDFHASSRTDMIEGKKLDAVIVRSNKVIKQYNFSYAYFDATPVSGNITEDIFGTNGLFRLKLLSLTEASGAIHTFTYNENPLPVKSSFAQDYWGFYNGATSNTSFVPNPFRLNIAGMADNGNNNSANLSYAQSGILTEIKYPTGGKTTFEYELNTFDNYWVPDYNSTANQISSGNGLRVKSIKYSSFGSVHAKATRYSYVGGKDLIPRNMFRIFPLTNCTLDLENGVSNPQRLTSTSYMVYELDGKGFFSAHSLASMNCVGYDKVIKEDIDENGNANGKIETEYNNTPDTYYSSSALPPSMGATLPVRKNENSPENGTVKKIVYYAKDNPLPIKQVVNTYTTIKSETIYGARIFGFPSLYIPMDNCSFFGTETPYWLGLPQHLIGYYPIYDKESLLGASVVTEYDENQNSVIHTKSFSYNFYNILNGEYQTSSKQREGYNYQVDNYTKYAIDLNIPGTSNLLLGAHRFTEPVETSRRVIKGASSSYPQYIDFDKVTHHYTAIGDKVLRLSTTINNHPGTGEEPTLITYNQYDNYGNLLEYTEKGKINSLLWDYNGEYVTAEIKNAAQSDIAHTSFEAESQGNFTILGTSVSYPAAFTGSRIYQLSTGLVKKQVDESKNYLVSLWAASSAVTVNGQAPTKVGITRNEFTYYEWKISDASWITIEGNANIDELRLYPTNAQMATYTYEPLIGISTQCDVNNNTTYYEYDKYSRLNLIRDQDKNIIKKLCYNYSGQSEKCFEDPSVILTNTTNTIFTITFTSVQSGTVTSFTGYPNSIAQQIGQIGYGNYNITITAAYPFTGSIDVTLNGASQTGNSVSYSNITVDAPVNIAISPVVSSACSFNMNTGFVNISNSINNYGSYVSFYIVYHPTAAMLPGVNYWVGTINESCRPASIRTIAYSSSGRNWSIEIHPDGKMYWQLSNESPQVNANTVISTNTLQYNL